MLQSLARGCDQVGNNLKYVSNGNFEYVPSSEYREQNNHLCIMTSISNLAARVEATIALQTIIIQNRTLISAAFTVICIIFYLRLSFSQIAFDMLTGPCVPNGMPSDLRHVFTVSGSPLCQICCRGDVHHN